MRLVLFSALIPLLFLPAFAETYNDSISLPLPENVNEIFKNCKILTVDDLTLEYQCNWKFNSEFMENDYDNLIEEYGLISNSSKPVAYGTEQEPTQKEEKTIFTSYENDLKRFEKNPPRTEADKEYFELLQYLGECQRGYLETKGIQQNDYFAVSHVWVNDGEAWLKSIDYQNNHKKLVMAIEACIAQRTILNPMLGDYTLNKGAYFGIHQKHHSEIINHNWEIIPTPDKLTIRDFEETQERAGSICHQNAYYCELEKMRAAAFVDMPDHKIQYHSSAMKNYKDYKIEYNLP